MDKQTSITMVDDNKMLLNDIIQNSLESNKDIIDSACKNDDIYNYICDSFPYEITKNDVRNIIAIHNYIERILFLYKKIPVISKTMIYLEQILDVLTSHGFNSATLNTACLLYAFKRSDEKKNKPIRLFHDYLMQVLNHVSKFCSEEFPKK